MNQLTISGVDDDLMAKVRHESARRHVSVNEVLLEALRKGLGVDQEPVRRNNLDRFAGDSDFGPDWETQMAETSRIDPEDWK